MAATTAAVTQGDPAAVEKTTQKKMSFWEKIKSVADKAKEGAGEVTASVSPHGDEAHTDAGGGGAATEAVDEMRSAAAFKMRGFPEHAGVPPVTNEDK